MNRNLSNAPLSEEGSWVLEGDEPYASSDEEWPDHSHSTSNARRQRTRNTPQPQPGPELIMPTITHGDARRSNVIDPPDMLRRRTRPSQTASPRQRARPTTSHLSQGPDVYASQTNLLHLFWTSLLLPSIEYALSILFSIFGYLQPFLAILLGLWLVTFTLRFALPIILAPVCALPFTSSLLPFCLPSQLADPSFPALMTVQSALDSVLTSTAAPAIAGLPADMKRSEAGLRDLRTLVAFSHLPSRGELDFELGAFVDAARGAGADLARFNARVGRALDRVLAANRWTLSVLASVQQREASTGALSKLWSALIPFGGADLAEDVLRQQYVAHASTVEGHVHELVMEAHALLAMMRSLDDRLDAVRDIAHRDGLTVKGAQDDLFANIWTWVGGNRKDRRRLDEQLGLLREVGRFRRMAEDHLVGLVVKLQDIGAGLEDLRERVAAPELLDASSGPIVAKVPLRVHIDSIQLGVERLETLREDSRTLEHNRLRRVLDSHQDRVMDEGRMIDGR